MTSLDKHQETIARIKDVRAQAIEHTRQARRLALERRDLMQSLLDAGWSQSDIARELDVSRQAIQKMMSMVPSS
jgi:DNA-binding NarL/FixJ family response regulator